MGRYTPGVRPDTVRSATLLREARLRAGHSQQALAELSGKDRAQIARWEQGAVAPSLDTAIELIRACGFDLPLVLVPSDPVDDAELARLQRLSPERRLDRMLKRTQGAGALTPAPHEPVDPRHILDALERNYVAYVLIGGLAQVLRGADEITHSIDMCPSLRPENLIRLETACAELEAHGTDGRPLTAPPHCFEDEAYVALRTPFGTVNVIAHPAGAPDGFDDLRRAATKEPLGHGLAPHVASTGDLARLAAARPADPGHAPLPQLRRILELEADRGRTLTRAPAHRRELDHERELER